MLWLLPYLKWLHILGAIAGLGANLTFPVWLKLAKREPNAVRFTVYGIEVVEKVANAGYATVLLTGIGMVLITNIPWTTPWLLSALFLFGAIGIVIGSLYLPAQKKLNVYAEQPESPQYFAAQKRTVSIMITVIVLVVSIEFLMTVKPALW